MVEAEQLESLVVSPARGFIRIKDFSTVRYLLYSHDVDGLTRSAS